MQFIFDLIWTQSCNRYLAAMGQLEGSSDRGFSSCSLGDQPGDTSLRTRWMPIAPVKPKGQGEDFVCGPIRGIAMVRRRNAVDSLTIRVRASPRPTRIAPRATLSSRLGHRGYS